MGDGEEESLKHALFESAIMTFKKKYLFTFLDSYTTSRKSQKPVLSDHHSTAFWWQESVATRIISK